MQLRSFESLQKLVLPDRWQAEAIQALRAGADVVVSAPTGAGKTYVFERWAEQSNFSKRALFTVPTRALANDKYAEWRGRGWQVGIVTGDLTVNPEAPVVVATLEAVQSLWSSGTVSSRPEPGEVRYAAEQSPFQLLVIDEYHWLADPARGNHYEAAILFAPSQMQLLLLSGAVANPQDPAAWLKRLGRRAEVVVTKERPVPIEEVEVDDLVGGLPRSILGFWAKRVAGALRANYGPVLIFAPHRQDAERLARQFARELPLPDPITLTREQEEACGPALAKLIRARVAYHHSGLTYAQRAGVIEPLAKAGQLRAVVATLGLSAGINFSLRSVLITSGGYRYDQLEHEIEPHELLQMIGRAGRRGLDEAGFVLVSTSTPRLRRAEPLRLKRAAPLPWACLLRALVEGVSAARTLEGISGRFFSEEPIALGAEHTLGLAQDTIPCGQRTDTGRARLVRRRHRPFPGCRECSLREQCLALSTVPTPLWQWQRTGLLDRELLLTPRGRLVSLFLGPEGLALAAGLEDRRYPVDELVFDCANLFAGDRFAGTNPRRMGRLAMVCEACYRGISIDGFLERGVPPQYGIGASDIVRSLVLEGEKARRLLDEHSLAGRGDIDRLMTEWRSFVRQVASGPALIGAEHGSPLASRWNQLRKLCRKLLGELRAELLPELPPLTPEQRRPVNHRFLKARPSTSGAPGAKGVPTPVR